MKFLSFRFHLPVVRVVFSGRQEAANLLIVPYLSPSLLSFPFNRVAAETVERDVWFMHQAHEVTRNKGGWIILRGLRLTVTPSYTVLFLASSRYDSQGNKLCALCTNTGCICINIHITYKYIRQNKEDSGSILIIQCSRIRLSFYHGVPLILSDPMRTRAKPEKSNIFVFKTRKNKYILIRRLYSRLFIHWDSSLAALSRFVKRSIAAKILTLELAESDGQLSKIRCGFFTHFLYASLFHVWTWLNQRY